MKQIILMLSLLVFSKSALAISDQELVTTCFEVGKAKVMRQVKAWGCEVNLKTFHVSWIDNRFYNPSKYISYRVLGECSNGFDRVDSTVQYYRGQCF